MGCLCTALHVVSDMVPVPKVEPEPEPKPEPEPVLKSEPKPQNTTIQLAEVLEIPYDSDPVPEENPREHPLSRKVSAIEIYKISIGAITKEPIPWSTVPNNSL